jgi:hypothetical protein
LLCRRHVDKAIHALIVQIVRRKRIRCKRKPVHTKPINQPNIKKGKTKSIPNRINAAPLRSARRRQIQRAQVRPAPSWQRHAGIDKRQELSISVDATHGHRVRPLRFQRGLIMPANELRDLAKEQRPCQSKPFFPEFDVAAYLSRIGFARGVCGRSMQRVVLL